MSLRWLRWGSYGALACTAWTTAYSTYALMHRGSWWFDGTILATQVPLAAGLCWNLARIRRLERRW